MGASVWPVTERFVAEIGDVDLARLDEADFRVIEDAFNRYAVLIFPDQALAQDQHVAFAQRFGPIDRSMVVQVEGATARVPIEIADVSNLDAKGEIMALDNRLRQFQLGNQLWHTDSAFKPVPAKASLLYQRSIAQTGGQTEFADMRAAWDALPQAMQHRVQGLIAEHAIAYSRAKLGFPMTESEQRALPPVMQVLVRTHPGSGRKCVYLAAHAGRIVGMPAAEGKALLAELTEFATQRQFVHSHRWRVNDLVMWDNRCTMHRGRAFDDQRWKRDAQRATVEDVANTLEQEGVLVKEEGYA
ncbi:MAG: TauD/TfdA family dioxygenase [Betaproteobacteria bacterium]|nr:TauD/TfdA family dioxygenase [Betaproteobacteria bacterium]